MAEFIQSSNLRWFSRITFLTDKMRHCHQGSVQAVKNLFRRTVGCQALNNSSATVFRQCGARRRKCFTVPSYNTLHRWRCQHVEKYDANTKPGHLFVSSCLCGRKVLVVRTWHGQRGQARGHLVHSKGTRPSVVAGSQCERAPKPDQVAGQNPQVSAQVCLPELQNINIDGCTDFTKRRPQGLLYYKLEHCCINFFTRLLKTEWNVHVDVLRPTNSAKISPRTFHEHRFWLQLLVNVLQ